MITKEALIAKLKDLSEHYDTEAAHVRADDALIEFINDEEISAAYNNISKWYA